MPFRKVNSPTCIAALFMIFTLTGCMTAKPASTPTTAPSPVPSITLSPTRMATAKPLPITTELVQQTPIILEQPTSAVPTELAESFANQKFPAAMLNIYNPGPNSKIASPINISAYAYPGYDGKVTLQLFGEDGRLMADQLIQLTIPDSGWVSFSTQVPFEINSAGESALLALTTLDGYGRRVSVNSIPLLLIQVGDSEIEVPDFQQEPIEIRKPSANESITGGTLHLEGFVHPENTSPLIVELFKTNGAIVASKQIGIPTLPAGQDFVKFTTDLNYSVRESTPVRLTLRQTMDKAPFLDVTLSSLIITLKP